MEYIVLFLVASLGLIAATFSKLLADEFKAWRPSIVSSILAVAVRALPPSRRDRSAEEWESHVDEYPGDLSKIIVACGCMLAAWRIASKSFVLPRRAVDLFFSLSGLLLLAPLLIVALVITLVSSPGPVLSRHRKIGPNGKPIDVFRFRTMVQDSPQRLRELLESDPVAAAEWAATGKLRYDPRVTAAGSILRKSSFDELPQLFNVLKGDLSIDAALTDDTIPEPARTIRRQSMKLTLAGGVLAMLLAVLFH